MNRTRLYACMPIGAAWRRGARARAAVELAALALVVALVVGLTPRLLRDWNLRRFDLVLSAVVLYALPLAVLGALWVHESWRLATTRPGVAQRLQRNRWAVCGALAVGLLCLVAALAPLLAPFDPNAFGDIASMRYRAPDAGHWLGTDALGRDVLSRLLYGARISLGVGILAATLTVAIGTTVGLFAGYLGRRVDAVLMRGVDLLIAFPRIFLVLFIVSLTEPSIWVVVIVIGATSWMSTARLVRAQVLSLREADYVHAARALGMPLLRILLRHVLPNTLAPVVVSATLMVGQAILLETVLSFLGLGVQVPTPSWGAMIEEGRGVFPSVWWLATLPGVAITLTVVAFNLLCDGLRDVLDPHLQD